MGNLTATAIMTSEGQITVPVEVREALGLKTEDAVEFRHDARTGTYTFKPRTGDIMALYGSVKYDGPPATIEQLNQAVADHLAEEHERILREWKEDH